VDLDILLLRQTGKGIDIGAAQPLFADLNEGGVGIRIDVQYRLG